MVNSLRKLTEVIDVGVGLRDLIRDEFVITVGALQLSDDGLKGRDAHGRERVRARVGILRERAEDRTDTVAVFVHEE